jgi:hypothetical protein
MRKVTALISLIVFLTCASAAHAAEVYLWTDAAGNYHITAEPPPPDGNLQDVMQYTPQKPEEKAPKRNEAARTSTTEPPEADKCRVLAQTRRLAVKAREIAREAEDRAAQKQEQAEDLRERVGYDDEMLDDYKDDIRELEDAARRANLLAEQARIQAQEADLRSQIAAAEVDEYDCPGLY